MNKSIEKKKKGKKKKNVLNDWGNQPISWTLVDKDDRANFCLVKNQAEQSRIDQKVAAEKIALKEWRDIELPDVLTGEPIQNLQKIVSENKISIDSIYI